MRVLLDLTSPFTPEAIDPLLEHLCTLGHETTICISDQDKPLAQALQGQTHRPSVHVAVWTTSHLKPESINHSLWLSFVSQFQADVFILGSETKWSIAPQLPAPCLALVTQDAATSGLVTITPDESSSSLADKLKSQVLNGDAIQRPRLAMISPILPAKSGIADYVQDLWPALTDYYDVTLIDSTPTSLRHWSADQPSRMGVYDMAWFLENADSFDRVVYQLGNSGFHAGMLDAMAQIPGVVVLHDFYIGDYIWWEQSHQHSNVWREALLYENGFKALRLGQSDAPAAIRAYPLNYRAFRDALGVIVHSEYAKTLAAKWHGSAAPELMNVIGHVRQPVEPPDTRAARKALGFASDDFIVCSLGFVSPLKMHDRIVKAWAASELGKNSRCKLVFVGQNHGGEFGKALTAAISALPCASNITITGFTSQEDFKRYLSAADLAIQLRTGSRGETSGVVSHAMNHGTPLLVNANGSFAELDPRAALILPDAFDDAALVDALNTLYRDNAKREGMAAQGPVIVRETLAPSICALQYRDFIEKAYRQRIHSHPKSLLRQLKQSWPEATLDSNSRAQLAAAIDRNRAATIAPRRLLLDVTATYRTQLQSGIERVALALCNALVSLDESLGNSLGNSLGIVTPVYLAELNGRWTHFQANGFMAKQLGLETPWLSDHQVLPRAGDTLLTTDLAAHAISAAAKDGLFADYQARGVKCFSIVYDLLPISMPECFPPGADEPHRQWLEAIASLDGALCISKHVAKELHNWRDQHNGLSNTYRIGSFLLGANTDTFKGQDSRKQRHTRRKQKRQQAGANKVFLMVGTIEPRKGYLETLQAFSKLWQEGFDARLIIVGREGWQGLPDDQRRDIPQTLQLLSQHPELGKRLTWLNNAGDAELEQAYGQADCLIAASYDEGFGLPIVEATRHGVPVLARDLAVFREVAPPGTEFFKNGELASAIVNWQQPTRTPDDKHTISWDQSAQQVLRWLKGNLSASVATRNDEALTDSRQHHHRHHRHDRRDSSARAVLGT